MENREMTIDLVKLFKHLLRFCWIILICAAIGFAGMYAYTKANSVNTYTASATLYVYNGNPNMVNYSYTNTGDLNSAVQLLDTYKVVISSNKVMDAVVERLSPKYPGITGAYIVSTLSVGSVNETGVMRISCTTREPNMSAEICNAVVDVAPTEIIRVVGAGGIEVVDYAEVPKTANRANATKRGLLGGFGGAALAGAVLVLIFLLNQKVRDVKELENSYTVPVLAEIPRVAKNVEHEWELLITEKASTTILEAYNKLRMNLGFALVDKRQILLVSSALPGEGKSTIAVNLALTYARCGKKVLLIDGDLRRANQRKFFFEEPENGDYPGLSNVIIGEVEPERAINREVEPNLDLLLAGSIPPNPAELLSSSAMSEVLQNLEKNFGYDIIVVDMPPINVVSDPLILANEGVSMLYVVRQNYSDHREIRKAMAAIELAKMDLLGLVLYGENVTLANYTKSRYYSKYYDYYGKTNQKSVYGHTGEPHGKWALQSKSSAADKTSATKAEPASEKSHKEHKA